MESWKRICCGKLVFSTFAEIGNSVKRGYRPTLQPSAFMRSPIPLGPRAEGMTCTCWACLARATRDTAGHVANHFVAWLFFTFEPGKSESNAHVGVMAVWPADPSCPEASSDWLRYCQRTPVRRRGRAGLQRTGPVTATWLRAKGIRTSALHMSLRGPAPAAVQWVEAHVKRT